jgi:hypothetical protein
MPDPPYRMTAQSKEMAAERLLGQRKIILKWYWEFENVCEVQREWRMNLQQNLQHD